MPEMLISFIISKEWFGTPKVDQDDRSLKGHTCLHDEFRW
jgi:hypothetical protein